MKPLVSLLLVCLLIASSAAMAQTRGNEPTENFIPVYHVDGLNGSDSNDGKSAPFKTIKKAFATVAGAAAYIVVEPGSYGPSTEGAFPLSVPSGVVLTSREGARATSIQANHTARVFDFNGSVNAVISGFSIYAGDAVGTNPAVPSNGGAVIIRNGASVTLEQNIFHDNYAYGAPGTAAHPTGGEANGGAIYIDANSTATIRNNVFHRNAARGGKGLSGGSPAPGGVARASAIYAAGQVTLIHNSFARNHTWAGAGGDGVGVPGAPGGVAQYGGVYVGGAGVVANNLFFNHVAQNGHSGSGSTGPGTSGGSKNWDLTADLSTVTHNLYNPWPGQTLYPNSITTHDPHLVGQTSAYPLTGHLQPTSPARAAASPAYALAIDNHGIKRPSPASIGAVEPRNKYDVDRDGMADVIWRKTDTGENAVWTMSGNAILNPAFTEMLATGWTIGGTGDFDADGKADIFWRKPASGDNAIWNMNGAQVLKKTNMSWVASNWYVAGVDDFNGDGTADVLWRSGSANWLWFVRGTTILRSAGVEANTTAQIAGVGDFTRDGRADIFWRNEATGENTLWEMNGTWAKNKTAQQPMPNAWKVVGVGDFYGDGYADVFFRNTITGENTIFNYAELTMQAAVPTLQVADLEWKLLKVADFSGDGKADLFWRKADDGQLALWTMDGANVPASVVLPVALADPNWTVAP